MLWRETTRAINADAERVREVRRVRDGDKE
jgi:hypothetical protein